METLAKTAIAPPGSYLRMAWKTYRPPWIGNGAVLESLKKKLWESPHFVVVTVSPSGANADVRLGVDYEVWEAQVRVNRTTSGVNYGQMIAPFEAFDTNYWSLDAMSFTMVDADVPDTGNPANSLAAKVAETVTQDSQDERDKGVLGDATSTIKTASWAVIVAGLAYITGKLTGILK